MGFGAYLYKNGMVQMSLNYLTAMQHVRLPTLEISPVIIPLISPDLAVYLTLCPCFTGILHSCMRTPGSFRM
jgi:hypothetical protein